MSKTIIVFSTKILQSGDYLIRMSQIGVCVCGFSAALIDVVEIIKIALPLYGCYH